MKIDLGKPIAYGRTAEIYRRQDRWVLKLFYGWFDIENIEHEAAVSRAVKKTGLDIPYTGDIIQVNGRNGLINSRVVGRPVSELIMQRPLNFIRYTKRVAELQFKTHGIKPVSGLPSQRKNLLHRISESPDLPENLKSEALLTLDSLPEGDRLCHGNFHPGNILSTVNGEVIIDWIDATKGNPLDDLARTSVIALGEADTAQRGFKMALTKLFHKKYIEHYFNLSPGGEDEYRRWLPVIACARLREGIPEIRDWLIDFAEKTIRDI
ncbi:phosphotransferase [candidate division WOR-3 bacterium]|nr:phosphotransferase [candidate division WOR-3 bacterium]